MSIEMITLPIQLRSVIGNRQAMQQRGAAVWDTLINAWLRLKHTGWVMRGLQPCTIYISKDAKEVQFVDLLSMTDMDAETTHPVRSH